MARSIHTLPDTIRLSIAASSLAICALATAAMVAGAGIALNSGGRPNAIIAGLIVFALAVLVADAASRIFTTALGKHHPTTGGWLDGVAYTTGWSILLVGLLALIGGVVHAQDPQGGARVLFLQDRPLLSIGIGLFLLAAGGWMLERDQPHSH